MNGEAKVKVTTLGVICSECGRAVEDQQLLAEASFRRWKCPFCGAKHLSLNDERARSRIIESGGEDEPEQEEDHSVEITMLDPKEMQRRHEEFLKRKTL
jgi:DNA-directed RNA polymerase subunit RPC12/RpoP